MDPRALTGEELAAIREATATTPRFSDWKAIGELLAHIAALEGQVAEARAQLSPFKRVGGVDGEAHHRVVKSRNDMQASRDLWKQRAEEAERHLAEARDESADMQATFDLVQKRERPWIEKWRAATGKPLSLPDYGTILTWIVDRAEEAEAQRDALRAVAVAAHKWHHRYCLSPEGDRDADLWRELDESLSKLDRAWPTWRDAPPRVADSSVGCDQHDACHGGPCKQPYVQP